MEQQEDVIAGYYENYTDTQRELLQIELRKTRKTLFTIAAVVLIADMLALAVAGLLEPKYMIGSLIVPAAFVGLAFFAMKEPLGAMIIGVVILGGIWIYSITAYGITAAFSGWIAKIIIITLFIRGFQSAKEAQRIRKELRS